MTKNYFDQFDEPAEKPVVGNQEIKPVAQPEPAQGENFFDQFDVTGSMKGVGGGQRKAAQSLDPDAKTTGFFDAVGSGLVRSWYGKDANIANVEYAKLLKRNNELRALLAQKYEGTDEDKRNVDEVEKQFQRSWLAENEKKLAEIEKEKTRLSGILSENKGVTPAYKQFQQANERSDVVGATKAFFGDKGLNALSIGSQAAAESAVPTAKSLLVGLGETAAKIIALRRGQGAAAAPYIAGAGAAAQGTMAGRDATLSNIDQNFKQHLQSKGVKADDAEAIKAYARANPKEFKEALELAINTGTAAGVAEGAVTGGFSLIPGMAELKTAAKNPVAKFLISKGIPFMVEAVKEGGEEAVNSGASQLASMLAGGKNKFDWSQPFTSFLIGAASGAVSSGSMDATTAAAKKGWNVTFGGRNVTPEEQADVTGEARSAGATPPPMPGATTAGAPPVTPTAQPTAQPTTAGAPVQTSSVEDQYLVPPPNHPSAFQYEVLRDAFNTFGPDHPNTLAAAAAYNAALNGNPIPATTAPTPVATENVEPSPVFPGNDASSQDKQEWSDAFKEWMDKYGATHWNDGRPKPASYIEGTPEYDARVAREKAQANTQAQAPTPSATTAPVQAPSTAAPVPTPATPSPAATAPVATPAPAAGAPSVAPGTAPVVNIGADGRGQVDYVPQHIPEHENLSPTELTTAHSAMEPAQAANSVVALNAEAHRRTSGVKPADPAFVQKIVNASADILLDLQGKDFNTAVRTAEGLAKMMEKQITDATQNPQTRYTQDQAVEMMYRKSFFENLARFLKTGIGRPDPYTLEGLKQFAQGAAKKAVKGALSDIGDEIGLNWNQRISQAKDKLRAAVVPGSGVSETEVKKLRNRLKAIAAEEYVPGFDPNAIFQGQAPAATAQPAPELTPVVPKATTPKPEAKPATPKPDAKPAAKPTEKPKTPAQPAKQTAVKISDEDKAQLKTIIEEGIDDEGEDDFNPNDTIHPILSKIAKENDYADKRSMTSALKAAFGSAYEGSIVQQSMKDWKASKKPMEWDKKVTPLGNTGMSFSVIPSAGSETSGYDYGSTFVVFDENGKFVVGGNLKSIGEFMHIGNRDHIERMIGQKVDSMHDKDLILKYGKERAAKIVDALYSQIIDYKRENAKDSDTSDAGTIVFKFGEDDVFKILNGSGREALIFEVLGISQKSSDADIASAFEKKYGVKFVDYEDLFLSYGDKPNEMRFDLLADGVKRAESKRDIPLSTLTVEELREVIKYEDLLEKIKDPSKEASDIRGKLKKNDNPSSKTYQKLQDRLSELDEAYGKKLLSDNNIFKPGEKGYKKGSKIPMVYPGQTYFDDLKRNIEAMLPVEQKSDSNSYGNHRKVLSASKDGQETFDRFKSLNEKARAIVDRVLDGKSKDVNADINDLKKTSEDILEAKIKMASMIEAIGMEAERKNDDMFAAQASKDHVFNIGQGARLVFDKGVNDGPQFKRNEETKKKLDALEAEVERIQKAINETDDAPDSLYEQKDKAQEAIYLSTDSEIEPFDVTATVTGNDGSKIGTAIISFGQDRPFSRDRYEKDGGNSAIKVSFVKESSKSLSSDQALNLARAVGHRIRMISDEHYKSVSDLSEDEIENFGGQNAPWLIIMDERTDKVVLDAFSKALSVNEDTSSDIDEEEHAVMKKNGMVGFSIEDNFPNSEVFYENENERDIFNSYRSINTFSMLEEVAESLNKTKEFGSINEYKADSFSKAFELVSKMDIDLDLSNFKSGAMELLEAIGANKPKQAEQTTEKPRQLGAGQGELINTSDAFNLTGENVAATQAKPTDTTAELTTAGTEPAYVAQARTQLAKLEKSGKGLEQQKTLRDTIAKYEESQKAKPAEPAPDKSIADTKYEGGVGRKKVKKLEELRDKLEDLESNDEEESDEYRSLRKDIAELEKDISENHRTLWGEKNVDLIEYVRNSIKEYNAKFEPTAEWIKNHPAVDNLFNSTKGFEFKPNSKNPIEVMLHDGLSFESNDDPGAAIIATHKSFPAGTPIEDIARFVKDRTRIDPYSSLGSKDFSTNDSMLRQRIAEIRKEMKAGKAPESTNQSTFRERVENDEVAKGILDYDYMFKQGGDRGFRNVAEIAEEMNVGIKNISRLMQQLVREKLVKAWPGKRVETAMGSYTTTYSLADGVSRDRIKSRLQEIAGILTVLPPRASEPAAQAQAEAKPAQAEAPRTDIQGVKGLDRGIKDQQDLVSEATSDDVRRERQRGLDEMLAVKEALKDKPTDNRRLTTQRKKLREMVKENTFKASSISGLLFAQSAAVRDVMNYITSYESQTGTAENEAERILEPFTDNEPADVTEARKQLSSIIKNMSKGEGWNAKRDAAEKLIAQFEAESALLDGTATGEIDFDIISDDALNEFMAKFTAEEVGDELYDRVGYELATREDNKQRAASEFGEEGEPVKGDLIADIEGIIASSGGTIAIPTLPAAFGHQELLGLAQQLGKARFLKLARLPKRYGKVDAKRAETDLEYKKNLKDAADGMLSDLAQALASRGWTQVDPTNANTDVLIDLIARAANGETLTPQGGVGGVAAQVDMPAEYGVKRLYTPNQEASDENNPFSRRDVEEGGEKQKKEAKRIASNKAQVETSTTPAIDIIHSIEINGRVSNIVEQATTQVITTGTDRVRNAKDLAVAIGEWFAQRPQENAAVVVLDKDDKIIHVGRNSIGFINSASLYPALLAGQALGVTGAAKVWIAHNHPSETSSLSVADMQTSMAFKNLFDGSGVEYKGLIAIAGDRYAYTTQGRPMGQWQDNDTPKKEQKFRIKITERIFTQKGRLSYAPIMSSDDALSASKVLLDGNPGILLLDNSSRPVAAIPMTVDQMLKLRQPGVLGNLIAAIERTNGSQLLAYVGDGLTEEQAIDVTKNLSRFTSSTGEGRIGIEFADVVDGNGMSYRSERSFDKAFKSQRDQDADARKADELERRKKKNAENRAGDPEGRKGYAGIIARVTDELRLRGGLTPKQIEGVTRIMNKIGSQFFEDVKMRINKGREGELGQYDAIKRIVSIFAEAVEGGQFEETAAHEIAHHITRFLPEADRLAIIKEMREKRADFLKDNKGLGALFDANDQGDWAKRRFTAKQVASANLQNPTKHLVKLTSEELKKGGYKPGESIYRLRLTDETYRLTTSDEYFAEEFKDRVMAELNTDPVYLGRSRNWKEKLAGLWETIKVTFRQLFGKEIAAKILKNFAKGRYNADLEGGVSVGGRGSDILQARRDNDGNFQRAFDFGEGPERFKGKDVISEKEFEEAKKDPKFNEGNWELFSTTLPDPGVSAEEAERTGKKARDPLGEITTYSYRRKPQPTKMTDPAQETKAQDSLPPPGENKNPDEPTTFLSVRDASEEQSEDPDLFSEPRKGASGLRVALDIVTLRYLSGISAKAHQNASRFKDSKVMKRIANIIHARPGTDSNAFERDMPTAITTARTKFTNKLNKIMEPLRETLGGFKDTDQGTARQQREEVYQALTDMITGRRPLTGGAIGKAAVGLKQLLAQLHQYRMEAGEKMGEIEDYFPAVYDSLRIGDNRTAFVRDAKEAYILTINKLGEEEIAKLLGIDVDAYNDLLSVDPESVEDSIAEVAEEKAKELYNMHVRGGAAESFDSIFGDRKSGPESPLLKRKFGKEAQDIMRKWQVNDPFRVVGRYISSAAKRTEVVRRFGADGKKWSGFSKAMERDGIPYSVIEETADLVKKSAGIELPARGKAAQTYIDTITLITAASAMGKGFMNNLVEPISIGIRAGNALTTIRAYAETWARFLREVAALSPALKAKMGDTFWTQYGNEIGTIHNSFEDAWMTTHSIDMDAENADPRFRWLTNRIYKANLMDASETAKQQASHAIGFSYINRVAELFSGNHWTAKLGLNAKQSATDNLNELGIPPSKHEEFSKWCQKLSEMKDSERMIAMTSEGEMSKLHQEAMIRFSMQSSVRTNRAHKPVFQDTELGKTYLQLMNFSYAYAAEVNSRLYDMIKRALMFSPPGKDYSLYDRLRMIAPIVIGALSIAAYRGLLELKDMLYPTESAKQRAKDPAVVKWLNATSYAGLLGPKFEMVMKTIKRDQAPGGPTGQMVVNTGRAAKSALEALAEGKSMQQSKITAAKAAIPIGKSLLVAGASAAHPVLGAAAVQATNAPQLTNKLIPDKDKGGLTPDVFKAK